MATELEFSIARTDTGDHYGLAGRVENETRCREMLAVSRPVPSIVNVWRHLDGSEGSIFRASDDARPVINLYLPFRAVRVSAGESAVEVRSWQSSLFAVRWTDVKNAIIFGELLPTHRLLVSSCNLTREGARFWFDLLGHAVQRGLTSGVILRDGTRHLWCERLWGQDWLRALGVSFEDGRSDGARFFLADESEHR